MTSSQTRLPRPRRARRPARPRRPWAVTANALLLLLQAGGFGATGVLYLGRLGALWPLGVEAWEAGRIALATGFVFAVLALLALVAAGGFLRQWRQAWVVGVMVQGVELLLALILFYRGRPAYVHVMMVYGIFMVLYLHQADVQAAFRPHEPVDAAEQPA